MTTQDSQSELDDIFNEHVENIQEGVVSAIQVGENVDYHTFDAKVELREAIEAYVTTRVKEAEELLQAEVNFYKDRCKMERNKYDILAKSTQEKVKEAERNGVAWTIIAIDDLHINHVDTYQMSSEIDQIYKGIKNTIRDRFKNETGIDPAPDYPINVTLTTTTNGKEG